MKRNVTLLIVVALCLSVLFTAPQRAQAQAQPQTQQAAQKLEKLSKQLKLTPEQKLQLLPVLKGEGPKVQAIKSNTSLTDAQKLEQLKAVHQETDPQVKAILSPEQYEQFQKIRQKEIQQAVKKKIGG
jgi:Spy/CpxP family protein refolding chaperone